MIVNEHALLELIHEPHVLIVRSAELLKKVVAESVQRSYPQLRDAHVGKLGPCCNDRRPILRDAILPVTRSLLGERREKDRLRLHTLGLRRSPVLFQEAQCGYLEHIGVSGSAPSQPP